MTKTNQPPLPEPTESAIKAMLARNDRLRNSSQQRLPPVFPIGAMFHRTVLALQRGEQYYLAELIAPTTPAE